MFTGKAKPVAVGGLAAFVHPRSEQWLLSFILLPQYPKTLNSAAHPSHHTLLGLKWTGEGSREQVL